MEDQASLRQTVIHLFDAVRHGKQALELEQAARNTEDTLEKDIDELEKHTAALTEILSTMREDSEEAINDLARQVGEFYATAKEQARSKLEKRAKAKIDERLALVTNERDKAIKSLEAYLATNPLPLSESSVTLKLAEGSYEGIAVYQCDGELKYEFGLAVQNSKYFHQESAPSQLGREIKIPVRFGRPILKGRVPGFERLDQYQLVGAELSNGKFRANFRKPGSESKIKIVMSGFKKEDFVGLEYGDKEGTVNVMTDLSLMGHVDFNALKSAMSELARELTELSSMKVTLLRLSLKGESILDTLNCYKVLETVMNVLGPKYRSVVEHMPENLPQGKSSEEMSLHFVRERLRLLGEFSKPVSQLLGLKERAII